MQKIFDYFPVYLDWIFITLANIVSSFHKIYNHLKEQELLTNCLKIYPELSRQLEWMKWVEYKYCNFL